MPESIIPVLLPAHSTEVELNDGGQQLIWKKLNNPPSVTPCNL